MLSISINRAPTDKFAHFVGPINLENASKAFGLEHLQLSLDCNVGLPAFSSIWKKTQHAASEDLNLGVDTEIGDSPYKLQHGESLVGSTDPGVDFLFTVAD